MSKITIYNSFCYLDINFFFFCFVNFYDPNYLRYYSFLKHSYFVSKNK